MKIVNSAGATSTTEKIKNSLENDSKQIFDNLKRINELEKNFKTFTLYFFK